MKQKYDWKTRSRSTFNVPFRRGGLGVMSLIKVVTLADDSTHWGRGSREDQDVVDVDVTLCH